MTTKRRVFLGGNGSRQINVEGLGAYVPATDLLDVKQKLGTEIQQLKDQVNSMQLERSTHIDDIGIDRFTNAMRLKMAYARSKGRSGWNDPALCSGKQLAAALVEHLSKGNDGTFEDVANFAMMLHQRQESPSLLVNALNDIRAKSGKDGFIAGVLYVNPTAEGRESLTDEANKYADSIAKANME